MTRTDKLLPGRIPFDDAAVVRTGWIDGDDRLGFLGIACDRDRHFARTHGFDRSIRKKISKIGDRGEVVVRRSGPDRWQW